MVVIRYSKGYFPFGDISRFKIEWFNNHYDAMLILKDYAQQLNIYMDKFIYLPIWTKTP